MTQGGLKSIEGRRRWLRTWEGRLVRLCEVRTARARAARPLCFRQPRAFLQSAKHPTFGGSFGIQLAL